MTLTEVTAKPQYSYNNNKCSHAVPKPLDEIVPTAKTGALTSPDEVIDFLCNRVAPAIPDFSWTAATDAIVDKDGYVIVLVQATGHHNGAPLNLGPPLPSVPSSGVRVKLPPAVKKVKVEDGKITEIRAVGAREGATGPLALYKAVGGIVPKEDK